MVAVKNKLKSYRHKLEMNQKEFAMFLEVDLQHYNDWENQRKQPSLQSAYKISIALAIIGVAGPALLSAFGSGQAAGLVKSGTQLGCLVVFLCICVIAVNEFSHLIGG